MSLLDVLGLVAASLGIGGFSVTCPNKRTGLRLGSHSASLMPANTGNDSPGGGINIGAFDEHKQFAGQVYGPVTTKGGEVKNMLLSSYSGSDPAYIFLTGDFNGVCVSWVATTASSGVSHAFMVGDWFNLCNIQASAGSPYPEWYYGNIDAGTLPDGSTWYPLCGWIDRDQTDGHVVTEIAVQSAVLQDSTNRDLSFLCNPPNMGWRVDQDFNTKNPIFQRRDEIKPKPRDTRLVKSDIPSHNATYLCTQPGARGPDFISLHKGVFCDMETRTATPLCGYGVTNDSFDINEDQLVGTIAKRGVEKVEKKYSSIENWEHEELAKRAQAERDAAR